VSEKVLDGSSDRGIELNKNTIGKETRGEGSAHHGMKHIQKIDQSIGAGTPCVGE
jgi:hypothetical protein